jgi:uncharacterized membrane protein YdfJ with MMPL/SSD domain
LFFAMFTNLTILPALLLTLNKGDHKNQPKIPKKKKKKKGENEEPIVEAE